MYRPGSVTRPAFCHVILLTTGHFSFLLNAATGVRRPSGNLGLYAGPERFIRSHFEDVKL